MMITVGTFIICPVLILRKKLSLNQASVAPVVTAPGLAVNNAKHNEALANGFHVFLAALLLTALVVPFFLARQSILAHPLIGSALSYLNVYFTTSIIIPSAFFAQNKKARKYCIEEIIDYFK